jgi:ABC-2 type transport system ATP-binding protein
MPPPAVIRLDGLTVRYRSFVAVEHLDLAVRPGELFGLLGPNGAGKSTTIKVLIGQRRPSAGQASIFGLDIVRQWSAIKPKFGYVPDRENHFDEFSGRRNLEIFAGLYNADRRRVGECLAMVELSDAANVKVRNYSLGMRRKLLIARALLHRPQLLYLDEPTSNLDVHSTATIHRILRDMVAGGATVVLTTHDMTEVQELCDRVAILCKGKLVALDTPLSLRQRHHERKADVILADGARLLINLDLAEDRAKLAAHVSSGAVASVQTREFDFHAVFLKLTGTEFD